MIPFLVSYSNISAVVAASDISSARRVFQATELQAFDAVDRRKIRVNQVPGVSIDVPGGTTARVLKSAVTN